MRRRLDEVLEGNSSYKFFVVELAHSTASIGLLLQQKSSTRHDCCYVGFYIAPSHRGRGVGAQAMRLLVDHIFQTMKTINRIEAGTSSANLPSQRALEKAGFVRMDSDNALHDDALLYAITRSDLSLRS